jgi:hypothetical protein
MQISGSTLNFNWPVTSNTLTSQGANASKGSSSAAASGGLDATSQDNSVVRDFLNYAKLSPAERLRANILKSLGLTEDQLKALPPDQQKAVEQKIEQLIQQELQKKLGTTGQLVNVSA